ncbi:M48 family metalloprotease [Pontibaca methylaminivorans]|uniref:Putative metalloprotease n=1 Tax=Pontibaca methylaminivorans TaxID=515897 RepID=A0A1R3W8F5_9RHOB|nr:M48 family metalloprotease [Pontibaca methylaminivorans]SIT74281.1 putative metalloprotease [Pontibaca methylaminivorans]
MLRFSPVLLAVIYALVMYRFSTWRLHRELDARSNPLLDARLTRLFDRMADSLDLPQIRVLIYEIEPVNGLAAPDGRIFITRGFYRRFLSGEVSAEELASVVAHELGHVALGHARRRMIDFSGQNALRTTLVMVLGRFLPFGGAGIAALLAALLTTLLGARLSRQDEYEADAYAAALLTRSGIGIAPQKSLFRKLEAMAGHAGGRVPAWLMSHPRTDARITALEQIEERWNRRP